MKAAVATENRRITRENAKNKIEYDARKREIQNRLAARISIAMRIAMTVIATSITITVVGVVIDDVVMRRR